MPNATTNTMTMTLTTCTCEPDEPFCTCPRPVVFNDQPIPDEAIPFDPFHTTRSRGMNTSPVPQSSVVHDFPAFGGDVR